MCMCIRSGSRRLLFKKVGSGANMIFLGGMWWYDNFFSFLCTIIFHVHKKNCESGVRNPPPHITTTTVPRSAIFINVGSGEYIVAYFCHHMSDNYANLSDLYVVLTDIYVDLSYLYVNLLLIHSFKN